MPIQLASNRTAIKSCATQQGFVNNQKWKLFQNPKSSNCNSFDKNTKCFASFIDHFRRRAKSADPFSSEFTDSNAKLKLILPSMRTLNCEYEFVNPPNDISTYKPFSSNQNPCPFSNHTDYGVKLAGMTSSLYEYSDGNDKCESDLIRKSKRRPASFHPDNPSNYIQFQPQNILRTTSKRGNRNRHLYTGSYCDPGEYFSKIREGNASIYEDSNDCVKMQDSNTYPALLPSADITPTNENAKLLFSASELRQSSVGTKNVRKIQGSTKRIFYLPKKTTERPQSMSCTTKVHKTNQSLPEWNGTKVPSTDKGVNNSSYNDPNHFCKGDDRKRKVSTSHLQQDSSLGGQDNERISPEPQNVKPVTQRAHNCLDHSRQSVRELSQAPYQIIDRGQSVQGPLSVPRTFIPVHTNSESKSLSNPQFENSTHLSKHEFANTVWQTRASLISFGDRFDNQKLNMKLKSKEYPLFPDCELQPASQTITDLNGRTEIPIEFLSVHVNENNYVQRSKHKTKMQPDEILNFIRYSNWNNNNNNINKNNSVESKLSHATTTNLTSSVNQNKLINFSSTNQSSNLNNHYSVTMTAKNVQYNNNNNNIEPIISTNSKHKFKLNNPESVCPHPCSLQQQQQQQQQQHPQHQHEQSQSTNRMDKQLNQLNKFSNQSDSNTVTDMNCCSAIITNSAVVLRPPRPPLRTTSLARCVTNCGGSTNQNGIDGSTHEDKLLQSTNCVTSLKSNSRHDLTDNNTETELDSNRTVIKRKTVLSDKQFDSESNHVPSETDPVWWSHLLPYKPTNLPSNLADRLKQRNSLILSSQSSSTSCFNNNNNNSNNSNTNSLMTQSMFEQSDYTPAMCKTNLSTNKAVDCLTTDLRSRPASVYTDRVKSENLLLPSLQHFHSVLHSNQNKPTTAVTPTRPSSLSFVTSYTDMLHQTTDSSTKDSITPQALSLLDTATNYPSVEFRSPNKIADQFLQSNTASTDSPLLGQYCRLLMINTDSTKLNGSISDEVEVTCSPAVTIGQAATERGLTDHY